MTNQLGLYDPLFYAQEALIQLENALGMAARVHRGYERERNAQRKGSTIKIRKPGTFVAQDAPSAAQDLDPEDTEITLDYHKDVVFNLTDEEHAFTQDAIIDEHIRPAAYALANFVDVTLNDLVLDIPWQTEFAEATGDHKVITAGRKVMRDNAVPLDDASRLHIEADGLLEQKFLESDTFHRADGAGEAGLATQMRGTLGQKFGFNIFANQNVRDFTKGTWSTGTLAVNNGAGYAKGTETVNLDAGAVTGTLVRGDIIKFANHAQLYVVTNETPVSAAGNAFSGVGIFPKLKTAVSDNDAVTVSSKTSQAENCMFHRNAFALAMAPLQQDVAGLGARVATAQDPRTGLAIRSAIWWEGKEKATYVSLDILFGVKTLDPNLAVRLSQTS